VDSLSFNKKSQIENSASSVSFTGQRSIIEETGAQKYRFFAPPYDSKKYTVALEIVSVKDGKDGKNRNTGELVSSGRPLIVRNSIPFLNKENGTYDMDAKDANLPKNDMVGYRFVLLDKEKLKQTNDLDAARAGYLLDSGNTVKGEDGSFSYFSKRQGFVNKTGPMIHIFPDSYNVKDKDGKFVRNAFNKAGGNIQGMIDKLKNSKELEPYEMIITTPLFGGDDISSHGYWTANPFQISRIKGNINDFKELQSVMFDKGKSYVADGAFTSQNFEGPQFQHVLKWGKMSPFYSWFKLDKTDSLNTDFKLGILPDAVETMSTDPESKEYKKAELLKENIAFKIVNPKYIEKDPSKRASGDWVKNPDYDKSRPTYIQLYDKRLAGKQGDDIKNLITVYEKQNTDNPYDITTHQDSVQTYYFEVDPDDNRFKTKGATLKQLNEQGYVSKDGKQRKGYDSFFQMGTYSIVRKGGTGGYSAWDGQVDLVKMNISAPTNDPKDITGNRQVKNYFYGLASYWTKLTDDALMEHIAKGIGTDRSKTFDNIAKSYKNQGVTKNLLNYIYNSIDDDDFESAYKEALAKKSSGQIIDEAVIEFPLESVEFAPDLTAALSTPYITPRPMDRNTDPNQTKTELLEDMPDNIKRLYKDSMEGYFVSVLEDLDAKMPRDKKLFASSNVGELTLYGKAVARIVSSDIMKYGLVKALFPESEVKFDKNGNASYDPNLRYKGVAALGINEPGPEYEAMALAFKLKNGFNHLSSSNTSDLTNALYNRFKDISFADIETARAIMDKTGAGLNWRFDATKDVADLDQRRAQNPGVSFERCWDDVIDFWGGFIGKIRENNPASYVIAEVTDLWGFSRFSADNKNAVARKAIKEFENSFTSDEQKTIIFNFFQRFNSMAGMGGNDKEALDAVVSPETQKKYRNMTLEQLESDFSIMTNREYKQLRDFMYYQGNEPSKNVSYMAQQHLDIGKYVDPDVAERMLYDRTGATTGSNYSTFFGLYPELFGQNFEFGDVKKYRLHKIKAIEDGLRGFFKSASPQFINSSHIFLNNHDKPRPLHCMALDMELFLSNLKTPEQKMIAKEVTRSKKTDTVSSMGVAVGKKYLEVFEKAMKKVGYGPNSSEMEAVRLAIADLAQGKYLGLPADMERSKAFGYYPFDITMKHVIRQARYLANNGEADWGLSNLEPSDSKLSSDEQELFDAAFGQFEPYMDKLASVLKTMFVTVGVPTIYAGDESGHSGYETPTKNVELGIRNIIHHDWLTDSNKPYIKKFNNEVMAAAKIHKDPKLSALADGFPLMVPQYVKDSKGNTVSDGNHTALFKYNENGSQVLVVYSNARMKKEGENLKERAMSTLNKNVDTSVESINLQYELQYPDGDKEKDNKNVTKTAAPEGAKFKKLKYDDKKAEYVDDNETTYVVKNGKLVAETKINYAGVATASIELDDVANIFYRVA